MAVAKVLKQKLMRDFAQSSADTGSIEVQVAVLTEDIRSLTEHFKAHPQDFASKRGLLVKVARRKKFLSYLERNDEARYREVIGRLGLKR